MSLLSLVSKYTGLDDFASFDDERLNDDSTYSSSGVSCSSESTSASSCSSKQSLLEKKDLHLEPMDKKGSGLTAAVDIPTKGKTEHPSPQPSRSDFNEAKRRTGRIIRSNPDQERGRTSTYRQDSHFVEQKTKEIDFPEKTKRWLRFFRAARSKTSKVSGDADVAQQRISKRTLFFPLLWRRKLNRENGAFPMLPTPTIMVERADLPNRVAAARSTERRKAMRNKGASDTSVSSSPVIVFEDENSLQDFSVRPGCCPAGSSFDSTPGCLFSLCNHHRDKLDGPAVEDYFPLCNGERRTVASGQARFHQVSFLYASESASVRFEGDYYDDMASLLARSVPPNDVDPGRSMASF